jgi:hypothetical protein
MPIHKGIKRLSLFLGILGSVAMWIIGMAFTYAGMFIDLNLILSLIFLPLGFLITWGTTRLIFWVISGFKEEALSKQEAFKTPVE